LRQAPVAKYPNKAYNAQLKSTEDKVNNRGLRQAGTIIELDIKQLGIKQPWYQT